MIFAFFGAMEHKFLFNTAIDSGAVFALDFILQVLQIVDSDPSIVHGDDSLPL